MKKFILSALVFLFVCGCSVGQRTTNGHLPPGASNIQELNHYWLSFELNGKKYMYGDICGSESRVIIEVNKEQGL